MKFAQLQNKPLKVRIVIFIALLVAWFTLCSLINGSYDDNLERAKNLQLLWIVSAIVISLLWAVLFPKKRITNSENDKPKN